MNESSTTTTLQSSSPLLESNQIPVQVIMEPVLKPKIRSSVGQKRIPVGGRVRQSAAAVQILAPDGLVENDMNKVGNNVRYRQVMACRRGQFRDRQGRCHTRQNGL